MFPVAALLLVLTAEPPDDVVLIWGRAAPKPTCRGAVCGYGCVASGAAVACAKTPAGVCLATGGRAKCFDPDLAVLCAYGPRVRRPACLVEQGQIACGYDCKATQGKVACAATPRGTCNAMSGSVTCSDPPLDPGAMTACFRVNNE